MTYLEDENDRTNPKTSARESYEEKSFNLHPIPYLAKVSGSL